MSTKPVHSVKLQQVTKSFGEKKVLENLDLVIPKGRIVGLLGPNGSGKTTILKLITGLLTPTSGEVTVLGEPVGVKSKAKVSYLSERPPFDPSMTVGEVITYYEDFYEDFDRGKALTLMQQFAISDKDRIKTLSKGTKEKVALLLVMSRKASLYVLDEPIGGVDPATRDHIIKTIIQNYADDATVLIATHLIQDVEPILDEVIFLKEGNVFLAGSTEEIREKEGKSIDQLFREVFSC